MIIAAVIDIGTNSVKLTVAELTDPAKILKEESRVTRLGKDVDRDGKLSGDAMARTFSAIQELVTAAKALGATKIVGAGTSALRDASNGQEFIGSIRQSIGIEVLIIAGEREADLAFRAVTSDTLMLGGQANSVLLVFDIGGGSTELIVGMDRTPTQHTSLNIGAVRLTERHLHSDPPTYAEFEHAVDDARRQIQSFQTDTSAIASVCGVGGTATTLAALILNSKDVHGRVIPASDVERTVENLREMTLDVRKKVPLLEPERADIIVGGGAILLTLLEEFHCREFRVSKRGMRYGLLLEQRNA
jgi:exopolyphosphatase / guanosine-5'-triphosphate,3'-diphosphate pyrophosphatase